MTSRRRRVVGLGVAAIIMAGMLTACTPSALPPARALGAAPSEPATPAPSPSPTTAPSTPATSTPTTQPPATRPATTQSPTMPGPDGVQAAWVRAENAKPGTAAWRLSPDASHAISGFADQVYAADGQTVRLYVSTPASAFRVQAYRMGYYGGKDGRLVWTSAQVPGVRQPACPLVPEVNMVECDNWAPSLAVRLTDAFVPGDYLFKLVGSDGAQSYIPLTVWDPTSRATYVVKNDVLTWQAWNPYGGYDLYAGQGACPVGDYPPCSRARVVSFDRPYAYGNGAADFLGNELPLVEFLERNGLDVTYVTDLTLIQHPGILTGHKALLSLGHDECWDLGEREAVVAAQSRGLNIAFLGASAILRHVRVQDSPLGADREEVDYRDSSEDPLDGVGNPLDVTGNTWGSPPASWPAVMFVGEQYTGYPAPDARPASFVVADASSWIFAGTGTVVGTAVAGVVGQDVDGFDPGAHPADLQILGHSPLAVGGAQTNQPFGQVFYSDMTYYTAPSSQAGVFDSGTNNWINALTPCPRGAAGCPAAFVQQVTGNLLHLFGLGPAGRYQPSHANWQDIPPY